MSTKFSRRDALRLLGLSAGVTAIPSALLAQNEYGHPILLPENNGYQKLDKPITAIVCGAGNRGNVYGGYSFAFPDMLDIVGVADLTTSIRNERYSTKTPLKKRIVLKPGKMFLQNSGISTAMCGSILGNHTVDANCQARIASTSKVRLGKNAKSQLVRTTAGRDAGTTSSLCVDALKRVTLSHRASWSTRPHCAEASWTSFTNFRSRLVYLSCERPWPGQVARFRPRLRLLERIGVRIGRVGKAADLSGPVRRDEWRLGRALSSA